MFWGGQICNDEYPSKIPRMSISTALGSVLLRRTQQGSSTPKSLIGRVYMGFRATLNFRKFKVALNPMFKIFLNFAKNCILCWLSKFYKKKKFRRAVFEISALKAEIKGVFSRSQCCYGNLLYHENNTNVFTSDWAVV